MRKFVFIGMICLISVSVSGQFSVMKMVGKNAQEHQAGFGFFYFFDIYSNELSNKSLILEAFDMGDFHSVPKSFKETAKYFSIKAGYRNIFNDGGKTGFFIEPQAGFCMAKSGVPDAGIGKGLALALIAGYSLEVGEWGNSIVFGFKYESDLPGKVNQVNTIGFRIAFSFNMKDY